jgi:hypothetical protein
MILSTSPVTGALFFVLGVVAIVVVPAFLTRLVGLASVYNRCG